MSRAAQTLRECRLIFVIALLAIWVGAPLAGHAEEDAAAVEKVTGLNKKALDAYNNLDFEDARKILKQALDICAASGLDKHPIKARTHIHMGVVLIAAKQQELGIKQFRKAIEIQPDIQVTKSLANPEILQAFDEAGSGAGGGDASGAGAKEPSGGGDGQPEPDIRHSPVSRGKKGSPVSVVASISANVTGYTKVVLAYRAEGAEEFLGRDMKRSGSNYVGEIPEDATTGNLVAYYIEAEAEDESPVATVGTEEKPFIVALSKGKVSKEEGEAGGEEEEGAGGVYFASLLGGSGIGYSTGSGEVNADNKVKPGFAPSSVAHVAPEVGYFVTPTFRMSVQLRFQFVSGTTPLYLKYTDKAASTDCGADKICTPASSAFAALVRGAWFFGSDSFRPYVSLALGGGQIRHVVNFSSSTKNCGSTGKQVCVDTVLSGPVFAGGGAGVLFNLTPMFGLVAEMNTLLGFPKFTLHLDFNAGVAARF